MLEIIPVTALKDNYIWLLENKTNQHAVIVDPSEHEPVLESIKTRGLIPVAILITHHHWDHVGGIGGLTNEYDIPVYTPKNEVVKGSTNPVGEGDIINLSELSLNISILDVPGHTSGAVAYYTENMVFSGDTLFTAGCGRLFEGSPKEMYRSLMKIKGFPDDTLIYCGHEYTISNLKFASIVEKNNESIKKRLDMALQTRELNQPTVPANLEIEKQTNPFLRCEEKSVVNAASTWAGRILNNPVEVFATIRSWKDSI
ncbi:MAG: hydroxyacylglutathione hydrolase [Pseudomonadota bacterium]|nr:hydroxyacylglutathione hydrolase [Pseudomonadota bacterium]